MVVRLVVTAVVPGVVALETETVVPGAVVIVLPLDFGVCVVRGLVGAVVAANVVVGCAPEIVTFDAISCHIISAGSEAISRVVSAPCVSTRRRDYVGPLETVMQYDRGRKYNPSLRSLSSMRAR